MHALETAWEEIKREFAASRSEAARTARSQTIDALNQLLRRFRQYRDEEEWIRLVLEGAGAFARQVAVFSLDGGIVLLRGQLNLDMPEGFSFPAALAAAFESVCASKDQLTTLRTPSEVTELLSTSKPGELAYLFPINNDVRLAAILFASGVEEPDLNGLELVAGVASSILERRSNATLHAQISAGPGAGHDVVADAAPRATVPSIVASWGELDEKHRQQHLRAQRFARVAVAEMQLARPEASRAAREQGDIYLFLQKEIDRARETYRRQFMTISSMVDYLHLELVKNAAAGDESKLGADYPGQLV